MRGEIKIVDIDSLMPKEHLLRKIDKVIGFNEIYAMTEKHYCEDNGRPCCDPVVIVKIAFLQHIFGIRSLRQTIKELQTIERVFADAKEKHAMRYTFIKILPRVQNWVRLKNLLP